METFHHYQVLRREDGTLWELGRGAMGITYKAWDTNLRIPVALKVINQQNPGLDSETAKLRFVREARAAAALRHPNVASVYHLGNDERCFFYAMEFIDGETPEALVRRSGPLPAAAALGIALQVTLALRAAHKQNLIHRDIKPANLMLVREDDDNAGADGTGAEPDEPRLVKVIDFGLAKSIAVPGVLQNAATHGGSTVATDDNDAAGAASLGGFAGTPHFASPEQLDGGSAVDTRADLYSLGATLWYLLAGRPVFNGTMMAVFSQHLQRPPPFEELPAATPPPVRALLARLLQKDPADRPPSPAALKREIEECLAAITPGTQSPRPHPSQPGADSEAGNVPPVRPTAGTVLGGAYRLEERLDDAGGREVFRGLELAGNRPVTITLLPKDPDPGAALRLEETIARRRASPHPHLLETLGGGRAGDGSPFLVTETIHGFSLLDAMRRRAAPLSRAETLRLIGPAAAALDHATAHGLGPVALDPAEVGVHFPGDTPVPPEKAGAPLDAWPPFQVKLSLLPPTPEAAGDGTAAELTLAAGTGEQTMVATAWGGRVYQGPAAADGLTLNPFGRLVYELLGGRPEGVAVGRRTVPLAGLGETGNRVLRRGLGTDPALMPWETERAFVAALAAALEVELSPDAETLREPRRPTLPTGGSEPLVIPPAFLQIVGPPATRLRLVPQAPAYGSDHLPLLLVARTELRLGRTREEVDLVTWFVPRSEANDLRTRRVARAALRLEATEGRLLAHNPSAQNSLLLNGEPVPAGPPRAVPADRASVFLMGGEYTLEFLPCGGPCRGLPPVANLGDWAGAAAAASAASTGSTTGGGKAAGLGSAPVGSVRLTPKHTAPAFHRTLWLLGRAEFGRRETLALPLDDPALGERQGCFHHAGVGGGSFWVENQLENGAVRLDGITLGTGQIAPLRAGQTLGLGRREYAVQLEG